MWINMAYCALSLIGLAGVKLFLTCLFLFCWAACISLRSRLMDCICSTEERCEISLDLSWYCYTIWNETPSQEESNYLSCFGSCFFFLYLPLLAKFVFCALFTDSSNLIHDLANCINRSLCVFIFLCLLLLNWRWKMPILSFKLVQASQRLLYVLSQNCDAVSLWTFPWDLTEHEKIQFSFFFKSDFEVSVLLTM